MFRIFLLMLFLCGVTLLSGCLADRARAETSLCPSPPLPRVCVPDVKTPDCEVAPRPRACEPLKRPQKLSLEAVAMNKLNTVSRVSTMDMMRAIGR